MKPLIAIIGPTASGKTSLSIALAKGLGGQIICMDSMQVYKGMDIGTAKPTLTEMAGIKHHMLDVADPCLPYSVAQYAAQARECIHQVHESGQIPIAVGGTGLYLQALIGQMTLGGTVGDESIRQRYEKVAQAPDGKIELHRILTQVDPQTAQRLHVNDVRRVIRALEVYEITGKPFSQQQPDRAACEYEPLCLIGIEVERQTLIQRLNDRVDEMIGGGLAHEVKALLDAGVPPQGQAMQGIGYKQMIPYLKGEITLIETAEQIKINTRQYAKRQMTWFRRTPQVYWITGSNQSLLSQAEAVIRQKIPT